MKYAKLKNIEENKRYGVSFWPGGVYPVDREYKKSVRIKGVFYELNIFFDGNKTNIQEYNETTARLIPREQIECINELSELM
ncbi:hypothetical protein LCGC14_0342180 [marine sediment metagenome]|uniref:Uncharacterized protein n=1 Tax=marine sediment metagenome TaxID=412755 RepID=A0A0F9W0K8_9ZZZZ